MTDLDLSQCPRIDWSQFSWLMAQGIPAEILVEFMDTRVVNGKRGSYGYFDPDPEGDAFIAFDQGDDVIFWSPVTGQTATWWGRAFALGEDNIRNAGTYAFDNYLTIHNNPVDWLRGKCRGIVVVEWTLAFDMLRDAQRIAVSEELLPVYRCHMKPSQLPELAVIASDRRAAA